MGTLNCRKRRLSGIQSEHSYGIAIDISKKDEAVIKRDWRKNTASGLKLTNAAELACRHFSNIIKYYSIVNAFGVSVIAKL